MSDPKIDANQETQAADLRDLEPEVQELNVEDAEGAKGGLMALLLPAVQTTAMGDGSVRTALEGGSFVTQKV